MISDISDSRIRFRELKKMASEVTDLAVFVSEHGHRAVKAAVTSGMKPKSVLSFADLREAANYLKSELRRGDLALLKGRVTDHMSRVFFAQFGTIGWKTQCRKRIICDFCEEWRPEYEMKG